MGLAPPPFPQVVRIIKAFGLQSGNRKALRYYLACRRAFTGAQVISVAIDASRLSRKQVLLGCIATPENLAAWMPPQALSQPLYASTHHDPRVHPLRYAKKFLEHVYVPFFAGCLVRSGYIKVLSGA